MKNSKIILSIFMILNISTNIYASQNIESIPNATIWSKIDAINKQIKQAKKPLTSLDVSSALIEGMSIINDSMMEKNYQELKEHAYKTQNFKLTEKLEKRAKPLFELQFTGDSDIFLLNPDYLKKNTNKNTEAYLFLNNYSILFLTRNNINDNCNSMLPLYIKEVFMEGGYEVNVDEKVDIQRVKSEKQELKDSLVKWKSLVNKFKEPFFNQLAKTAVKCLSN